MRIRIVVLLSAVAVCLGHAPTSAAMSVRRPFDVRPVAVGRPERLAVVDGQAALALDVAHLLGETPGNFVFSPLSLTTTLAMAAQGAAGTTRSEIVSALRWDAPAGRRAAAWQSVLARISDDSTDETRIAAADGLFADRGVALRPAFVRALRRRFGAEARVVDFDSDPSGALAEVNRWGAERTDGLIPEALDAAPPKGGFVLADALRFEGKWAQPFASRTDDAFATPDGPVTAPFMRLETWLRYARTDEFHVVELPYRGDAFSMLVVVPLGSAGLAALTSKSVTDATSAMTVEYVDLRLPPFAFDSRSDFSDTLRSLGVTAAFGPEADFSRAARHVRLDAVRSTATVRVDEEGTVAAAVTSAPVWITFSAAEPPTPRLVRVDRPFLFFVRHRPTGAVLFLGRVEDPTK